jgi:hypothetical protein
MPAQRASRVLHDADYSTWAFSCISRDLSLLTSRDDRGVRMEQTTES